jgi:drug/metabolite transporter (DMT)-like permease
LGSFMNNELIKKYQVCIGLISGLCFCISSSFSRVFVSDLLENLDPFSLCFYTFTAGALFFILLNISNIKPLYLKSMQNLKTVFYLNLSTFGTWFFLIYALKFIAPSTVSIIAFGSTPLFALFLNRYFAQRKMSTRHDYIVSIGVALSISYIIFNDLNIEESNFIISDKITSLLYCFIVGISMTVNRFQTKNLIENNFSSLDVLSVRFIFLIIFSRLCDSYNYDFNFNIFLDITVLTVSLLFVIIPIFFMQISQKFLEPITISIVTLFMPILTYLFEVIYSGQNFENQILAPILIILILVILGSLSRYKVECK